MTTKDYSVELHRRIYNDAAGTYICVQPDTDALGLVQVGAHGDDGKLFDVITMEPVCARLVALAMSQLANELDPKDGK